LAQVIAADPAKIGIKRKVNVVPIPTWSDELLSPDKKVRPSDDWQRLYVPDPSFPPNYLLGTKQRGSDLRKRRERQRAAPALTNLVHQGVQEQNPAKRLVIYAELLQQIGAAAPYVVLHHPPVHGAGGQVHVARPGPVPLGVWRLGLYVKPA
jgi:ABC-type transport system substrate-binding protein